MSRPQSADMSVIQSVDRSIQEVILTTCLLCLQMHLNRVQVAEPPPVCGFVLSAKSLLSLWAVRSMVLSVCVHTDKHGLMIDDWWWHQQRTDDRLSWSNTFTHRGTKKERGLRIFTMTPVSLFLLLLIVSRCQMVRKYLFTEQDFPAILNSRDSRQFGTKQRGK